MSYCTCVVFLTHFDNCICWVCIFYNSWFTNNFRVFNSPLSCLFSNFSFCYYLVVVFCVWIVFIEVWVKLYIVSEWFFLSIFVSTFCACWNLDFLVFGFCCNILFHSDDACFRVSLCYNCYNSIVTFFDYFRFAIFPCVIKLIFKTFWNFYSSFCWFCTNFYNSWCRFFSNLSLNFAFPFFETSIFLENSFFII